MTHDPIADAARAAALRELGVHDAGADAEFHRYRALAAELLDAPLALVTLLDGATPEVQAGGAWPDPAARRLIHALGAHAADTQRPLAISDAREHPLAAGCAGASQAPAFACAAMPLLFADGQAVGALCVADSRTRAWSERELRMLSDLAASAATMLELQRALHRQSLYDPLTGLPNRALSVAHAGQLSASGDGVLMLAVGIRDIGRVKEVYGTGHGDRVTSLIAGRIVHQLDGDDVLGRVRGHGFVVLRPRVGNELEALDLARRIRAGVDAEPVTVRGDELRVSAAIGIAIAAGPIDGESLLVRALEASRRAESGDERIAVSAPGGTGVAGEVATRLRLRAALAGAVARGELTVAFQPIVDLASGRTAGFEALARWHHPELGRVGPTEFIPAAEATGDIVRIGEHVLRCACEQLARWRAAAPDDDLAMTVNVSPLQLSVPDFAESVAAVLADAGVPGWALTLEITEGVLVAPGALQLRNIDAIRALDVRIALDDFGTGYSALSYLKRLPVDVLKVDRSFLDGLQDDHRDVALMRAIFAIGDGMDLQVVAEGIETPAQHELLRSSGCRWGQGFLFSKPLPAEDIRVALHEGPARVVAGD